MVDTSICKDDSGEDKLKLTADTTSDCGVNKGIGKRSLEIVSDGGVL